MTEDEQRLFGGVLPLDDVESGAIDLAGRLAELVARLHGAVDALQRAAHGPGVGGGAGRRGRRADLDRAARRLAALRAAAAARRRGERGRRARRRARAGRGPRAAGRAAAGPPDPRQLPHRPPDDLHAGADAVGAAPRRLPARPRRRDVPAQGAARRRRPDARRPARRRARLAHRGPPAAAGRAAGRDRPADHHLHRPRRAHQPRAPAGGAGRRAARRVGPRASSSSIRCSRSIRATSCAGAPWSFDRVLLEGARAMAGERAEPRPFLLAPLPPREPGPLELDDLVRFVEHPARAFLRQRLGIRVGDWVDEIGDALPVELNALEQWGVGAAAAGRADARRRTAAPRSAPRSRAASSRPGQLGRPVVREIWQDVDEIAKAARSADRRRAGARLGRHQARSRRPPADRHRRRRARRRC